MTASADRAAVLGLKKYLKDNVSELQNVYDEWPSHGDELVVPSVSIMTVGTPTYVNHANFSVHSKSPDPDVAENDIIKEIIGHYDATLQVDIWTEYKPERGKIYDLVDNALNKEYYDKGLPQGLSLILADYHDVIARYDQVGYTYISTEEGTQKEQWRVKVDLLVNYPKIAVKSVPRIEEITVTHQISDNTDVSEDNADIEETYEVL